MRLALALGVFAVIAFTLGAWASVRVGAYAEKQSDEEQRLAEGHRVGR